MSVGAPQNYRRVQVTRRDGPTATVLADRTRTVRARGDELRVEARPVQRNVRVLNDLAGVAAALTDRLQAVIQDGGRTALAAPTTTGTSTDYLLQTAGAPILTLYDGLGVWLTPHTNSDAPPITLKVDSTPTKPVLVATASGTIPPYDDALRQGVPTLVHYSASADAWVLGADLSELSLNDRNDLLQGISDNTTRAESALTEAQAAHDAADQALLDAKTYAEAEVAKADQKAQDALDEAQKSLTDAQTYADARLADAKTYADAEVAKADQKAQDALAAADQFLIDAKTYADIEIDTATTTLKAEIEDPNGTSLGATLQNEYITAAGAEQAIASAKSDLKAEIEDPDGSSIGATLQNEYVTYTQSDSAISAATSSLKAEIEDPEGSSVGATLANDYRTLTETDQAIAQAKSDLKAEIEDPEGSSVGATLEQDYLTSVETDSAISAAVTTLKSEIEDPEGSSVGATLEQDYLTAAETDSAISAATTALSSELGQLSATLEQDYLTSVETDQAITQAKSDLKAEIEDPEGSSVGATLANDYLTSVETDSAISAATSALKAEIEDPEGSSVGATLEQDYLTSVETDSAISAATSALKSEIEDPEGSSVGATLANDYLTLAETDQAITQAKSELKSEIEDPAGSSVGATLANNYLTSAETESAISAARTTLQASLGGGSIVQTPNGNGGSTGGWTRASTDADVPPYAPSGSYSIRVTDGAREAPNRRGDVHGRAFRVTGWFKSPDGFAIAVRGSETDPESGLTILLRTEWMSPMSDWTYLDVELGPVSTHTASWAPGFDLQAGDDYVLFYDLRWEDVTDARGRVADVNATLTTDYYTSAQADQAISAAFTTLKSEIEDPNGTSLGATLTNDYLTSAETDQAITTAKDSLKAEIEDPEGNSLGAEVETQKTALADVQGNLTGAISMQASAGGAVSLLDLVALDGNSGPYSLARLRADDILLDGSVTAPKLSVDSLDAISADLGTIEVGTANIADAAITSAKIGDLEVDSAKIADLTVGTEKITGNAVTRVGTDTNGSQTFTTADYEIALDVTVPTEGGNDLLIETTGEIIKNSTPAGTGEAQFRIYRDGSTIFTSTDDTGVFNRTLVSTSLSGSTRIQVRVRNSAATSSVELSGASVVVTELKK